MWTERLSLFSWVIDMYIWEVRLSPQESVFVDKDAFDSLILHLEQNFPHFWLVPDKHGSEPGTSGHLASKPSRYQEYLASLF